MNDRFRWVTLEAMRFPRADARATLREDGSVQVEGGTYWDTARHCLAEAPTEVFDVAMNRWRGATRSPAVSRGSSASNTSNTDAERTYVRVDGRTFLLAHRREQPSLTALENGDVLVTGGFETFSRFDGELDDSSVGHAELIDLENGRVVSAGRLTTPSHAHCVVVLPSGAVLVLGGRCGESYTARVELGIPRGLEVARLGPVLSEVVSAALAPSPERVATDLAAEGRHEEALAVLRRALESDREDAFLLVGIGASLLTLERFREALAVYEQVVRFGEADPFFPRSMVDSARAQLQYLRLKEGAEGALEQVAGEDADLSTSPEWNNKGAAHARLGQHDPARACFERALRIDPDNDFAMGNLADSLVWLKRSNEALDWCSRTLALTKDPARKAKVLTSQGIAYYDLGRFSESVKSYDAANEILESGVSWNNRGNSLLKLKRYSKALASYDKAIALGYGRGHWGRACALVALARVPEARQAVKQMVAIEPGLEVQLRADPDLRSLFEE